MLYIILYYTILYYSILYMQYIVVMYSRYSTLCIYRPPRQPVNLYYSSLPFVNLHTLKFCEGTAGGRFLLSPPPAPLH